MDTETEIKPEDFEYYQKIAANLEHAHKEAKKFQPYTEVLKLGHTLRVYGHVPDTYHVIQKTATWTEILTPNIPHGTAPPILN